MGNPFERQERIIFHYTNLNALISILRNEGIVLWATNASYLNDPSELLQGIELINRLDNTSKIQIDEFKDYYLTSFSDNEDSLVMWNQYGSNGNGCCIGLDYNAICKVYGQVCKCTYGKEEAERHLNNTLNLLDNGITTAFGMPQPSKEEDERQRKLSRELFLRATCLMAKNEAYRHEQETRGYICLSKEQYGYVQFRTVKDFIAPYVPIKLDKSSLKTIILGPTLNADISLSSIKKLLDIRGYSKEISVKYSKIPFRG